MAHLGSFMQAFEQSFYNWCQFIYEYVVQKQMNAPV